MEQDVIAAAEDEDGDFWFDESKCYVEFGDGKLKTNKRFVVSYFMRKMHEKKMETKKMVESLKNEDDTVDDIENLKRFDLLKLHVLNVFVELCESEEDKAIINIAIDGLKIYLDIDDKEESKDDSSDPLGGILNMFSGLLGTAGKDKPLLPDLNSMGSLFKDNPQLQSLVNTGLDKLRGCNSTEDFAQAVTTLSTDQQFHQQLNDALAGTIGENTGINPAQLVKGVMGMMNNKRQLQVSDTPEYDS